MFFLDLRFLVVLGVLKLVDCRGRSRSIDRLVNTPCMQAYSRHSSFVRPELGRRSSSFAIHGRRWETARCHFDQSSHISGFAGEPQAMDSNTAKLQEMRLGSAWSRRARPDQPIFVHLHTVGPRFAAAEAPDANFLANFWSDPCSKSRSIGIGTMTSAQTRTRCLQGRAGDVSIHSVAQHARPSSLSTRRKLESVLTAAGGLTCAACIAQPKDGPKEVLDLGVFDPDPAPDGAQICPRCIPDVSQMDSQLGVNIFVFRTQTHKHQTNKKQLNTEN